ncbi:UDP-glycosyltransferase [Christiangramia aestuarii]|uniref:Glycosyltransferase family 4 protein n=1 Tax=Christiangramia aestuarii TaxID=1028746 RepID=A0A7K1LM21_9FLAO|nr:UDP-glycosyltransferase [Christiangramia aestuarii]MUP41783.1 glycosyltransferase family 4 protein [Christiangramia aestuarii]
MQNSPFKKILIVVESIDLENSSGAKGRVALIKNLNQAGFELLVYHYSRKDIFIEGIKCISIKEKRRGFLFYLSRIERYIRYLFKIKLNPEIEKRIGFSFTLLNDRDSIIAGLKEEKTFEPDWVLTLSQGGSFRPHHALLQIPRWHSKWIAYIHDPYPMHWYPKPYTWKESGYRIKQNFMEGVADKCTYAAFPSLLLKEWMGSHYKAFSKKGVVIPHQIDKGIQKTKSSYINLKASEFTILHAGNFLQARQPFGLIEGFKKFAGKYPRAKAKLIHIGPADHYREYLEKESEDNASIQVKCENIAFSEVSWLQENTSVNVIIEAKAEFSPFLPGKFPHVISSGKPILLLGPPKSEARRILGEDYPFWSEIDDENRISGIIEKLYLDFENGTLDMKYDKVERYLSPEKLTEIFADLNKE